MDQMNPSLQEYLLSTGAEVEEKDLAAIESLSKFAYQLTYLNASVVGGKLNPKDAEKRVKDLYKQWKASTKLLKELDKQ